MSATSRTSPSRKRTADSRSPSPSMSIAPREAKCSTRRTRCCGQARLGQYESAASSSRSTAAPQAGQAAGMAKTRSRPSRRLTTGATTCGITSPARCTITVSPTRMSLRWMSCSLWSEAMPTRAPPTTTGASTANGLSAPVRPTFTAMSSSFVVRCCGGNL